MERILKFRGPHSTGNTVGSGSWLLERTRRLTIVIELAINLEFVRSADKSFAYAVQRAAQIGYRYVEPLVHTGRELLSEGGFFPQRRRAAQACVWVHTVLTSALVTLADTAGNIRRKSWFQRLEQRGDMLREEGVSF